MAFIGWIEGGYETAMKRVYIDCSSGISGDMMLAALVDLGVDADELIAELKNLDLGGYEIKPSRTMRCGVSSARVEISVTGEQPHRHLSHIKKLINGSALEQRAKDRALGVFSLLAEAEAKIHNQPVEKVHFHEVGAVDSILDIVGCSIGVEWLGLQEFSASAVNVGGGQVRTEHGLYSVPAPATAELLKKVPTYSSGIEAELVTPTGAAFLKSWVTAFGPMSPMPLMKVERIGYGAGTKDFPTQPNVVRVMVGEGLEKREGESDAAAQIVSVIEANIDDMSPQLYGAFVEEALAAGALDVTCHPVQMKKNRPGLAVTILCRPSESGRFSDLLFDQTTTIGLRVYEARRRVLQREQVSVETAWGSVPMKVASRDGQVVNFSPEYEDCRRLAAEKGVPLKRVLQEANFAYMKRNKVDPKK